IAGIPVGRDHPGETPGLRPSDDTAATMLHPLDPRVADEMLQYLREWGWEAGLAKLDESLRGMTDARRRGILRLLSGWIKGQTGEHDAGIDQFLAAQEDPILRFWAFAGQAFIRYRQHRDQEAWDLLDQAQQGASTD